MPCVARWHLSSRNRNDNLRKRTICNDRGTWRPAKYTKARAKTTLGDGGRAIRP